MEERLRAVAYDLPELRGYRAMVSDLVSFIEQQVNYQELLQWTLCLPNLEKVGCEWSTKRR